MTKKFFNHNFPEVIQINTNDGRLYKTTTGEQYPSITSILSRVSDNIWLEEWKNKVGEDEAIRISTNAKNRGARIHGYCEDYLLEKPNKVNIFDNALFKQYISVLNNVNNIHALENRLVSHRFKTSGTVDLIAEYNNRLSIIDWKTSARIKKVEDIDSYFIQCAFYGLAFYEMFNIVIKDIVIVMGIDGVDAEKEAFVFIQPIKPWIKEFIRIRKEYDLRCQ